MIENETPFRRSRIGITLSIAAACGGLYFMCYRSGQSSAADSARAIDAKTSVAAFLNGGEKHLSETQAKLSQTESLVGLMQNDPRARQIPLRDLKFDPFLDRQTAVATSDRAAVLKDVQALQVQSIICNDDRRACMVNNTLYREGQTIQTLTIEKISPASVTVKNGPYRFELRVQN